MKVIFLDFDGVVRVPVALEVDRLGPDCCDFCPDRLRRVASICRDTGARVVVSSDWRHLEGREEIELLIGPVREYLADDWMTPVTGHRWNEVERWLERHPEVTGFAILDDFKPHFTGAPEWMLSRFVLCSNRHGFVRELVGEVLEALNLTR